MKLPNAEHAVIDDVKLRDYRLSTTHPRGKHKARVFERVLGLTLREADLLRRALLEAAVNNDVMVGELDRFGQRYVIDVELSGPKGKAMVRSTWIILSRAEFPRLVSCYVL